MMSSFALFTLPSIMALVFAIILLTSRPKRHQITLAGFLFCVSVSLAYLFMFRSGASRYGFILDWFSTTATLAAVPFFYMYIDQLTLSGRRLTIIALLIPVLLISTSNLVLYGIMGMEESSQYFGLVTSGGGLTSASKPIFWIKRVIGSYLYRLTIVSEVVLVAFLVYKMVKRYHRELDEFIATAQEDAFRGDRFIISGAIAFVVSAGTLMVLPYSNDRISPLYIIGAMTVTVAIFLIGYYGMFQKISAEDIKVREDAEKLPVSISSQESIKASINKLIEDGFFLERGVTIETLASTIGTNRTYLSNTIHKVYSCSFSDFVNSLRIDYAIGLIRESGGQKPIGQIAMASGFASASAMNRCFNKFKHMTPTEWIELYL